MYFKMYSINSYTTLILDKCFDFKTCTMTSTYMVCMSNKSILLSLVACVEFSYYIYQLPYHPLFCSKTCVGMLDHQAISNRQSLISLVQQMVSDYRDILD